MHTTIKSIVNVSSGKPIDDVLYVYTFLGPWPKRDNTAHYIKYRMIDENREDWTKEGYTDDGVTVKIFSNNIHFNLFYKNTDLYEEDIDAPYYNYNSNTYPWELKVEAYSKLTGEKLGEPGGEEWGGTCTYRFYKADYTQIDSRNKNYRKLNNETATNYNYDLETCKMHYMKLYENLNE